VTSSTFDVTGSPISTTYPAEGGLASEKVRTDYDATGRPSDLNGAAGYDDMGYTALGQVSNHTRFGTYLLYTDYDYDPGTGQLVTLQQSLSDGTTTTNVGTFTYTNDAAGNVTKIATTSATAATDTQCFGYDRLQELTRAWTPSSGDCSTAPTAAGLGGPAPYWTDYAVDPATGNRTGTTSTTSTAATTASYSYPTASSLHPHAVSSVTTTVGTGSPTTKSYGYNAEGDTTTRPGETLTYDSEGHLATVTDGANTQSNTYDADGTLLLQKDGSNYTLYLGPTELHKDGTGSVYAVRTYSLGGTAVAERTTGPTGGNTLRWLGGDNHNTATLEVVASSGTTTARYQDPYGNPRGTNPGWSSGHTFLNDDQATTSATVTIGARTYDPVTGKFLTVDAVLAPLDPLQNNGYAYSVNNPIGGFDPSGNCFLIDNGGCYLSAAAADHRASTTRPAPLPAGNGGRLSGDRTVNGSGVDRHVYPAVPYANAQTVNGSGADMPVDPKSVFDGGAACQHDHDGFDCQNQKVLHTLLQQVFDELGIGVLDAGGDDTVAPLRGPEPGSPVVNANGVPYPEVLDPRTGEDIPSPTDQLSKVSKDDRVQWGKAQRGQFIKEWYDRGYTTPDGGWQDYDIHHITPREYGGSNDFDNLVPVLRGVHQQDFNNWWRNYGN
jgi:RHS repeat-associated protein